MDINKKLKRWLGWIAFLMHMSVYGAINQDGDFQLWLRYDGKWKIEQGLDFVFETEVRYGDNASTAYFAYAQPGLSFKLAPWMRIVPGYRQECRLNTQKRRWEAAYDPLCDVIFNDRVWGWEIEERHRIRYTMHEKGKPDWEYRNRVLIVFPKKWGTMRMIPWIYDEVFFLERVGFSQNRFGVGGTLFLLKTRQVTWEPSYIFRYVFIDQTWRIHHVCRLALKCIF